MILEKQLLLPINLGRIIRPFPNYLESIILYLEKLFTSKKRSRQLLKSFQEWTESEKLQQNVKVHDSTIRKRLNKLACLEWLQVKASFP